MSHPNVPRNTELAFTTLCFDPHGPAEPKHAVLRTPEEYRAWCMSAGANGQHLAAREASIHFGSEALIAVAAGAQSLAGYRVEILRVLAQRGGFVGMQVLVFYQTVLSGPATQEETSTSCPQHIIKVSQPLPRIVSFHQVESPSDIPGAEPVS